MEEKEKLERIKFMTMYEPFPVWTDPWPHEDESVEHIEMGRYLAWLPFGDPTQSPNGSWWGRLKARLRPPRPDPFVHAMQEAHRVLAPGCTLGITVPNCMHAMGIGHPLQRRIFNKTTLSCFGRPPDEEMESLGFTPKAWQWDLLGPDFGTRFVILHWAEDGQNLSAVFMKPEEEEEPEEKVLDVAFAEEPDASE